MGKPRKWTLEKIKEESFKYQRRTDFQKNSRGAYTSARRQGFLEIVCAHMQESATEKYTDKEIIEIAKKYKTRSEFQKGSKAYAAAHSRGKFFLDQVCAHMISVKKVLKHTKETAALDAIKYKTRREFCVNDAGSYLAAVKNGWIDEICQHMENAPKGRSSKEEKNILNIIKEYFPEAKKKIFYNKNKEFRQSKYELDIYVPSLNKGVEYDGTYWHSTEVLAKNKKISLEQAALYHEEKDAFFKSLGIEVLHIKESFWNSEKPWQYRKILNFLKVMPMPPGHMYFRMIWQQNADENGEF